jgi:hypothetical protein
LRQRKASDDHRGHGKAIDDQAGGIVDHALAFDQRHYASGQPDALRGRTGSHRIRRRDDCAQYEGNRPRQSHQRWATDHRHDRRGNQHQTDRELHDRTEVGAEFTPGREPSRGIDERR